MRGYSTVTLIIVEKMIFSSNGDVFSENFNNPIQCSVVLEWRAAE